MRRDSLFLLAGAFALSIVVRLPQLDRPLGAHHELCTALVLTVLHNWHHDGFMAHKGVPPVTYSGPADRYPEGWTDSPALHNGVLYYVSHPPLAYDLPHLLFRLMGSAPHALGLQLFNIFFHGVAAGFLLILVRLVRPGPQGVLAGQAAALLYLFMPAPLWFHGNAYMSDMFVQVPWLFHLLVAMRLFSRSGSPGKGELVLFGSSLFVTLHTSWLGAFAALASVIVAVWCRRSLGRWGMIQVMLVAGVAVSASMIVTAWRYLQVFDAGSLMAYFHSRFAVRGPASGVADTLYHVRQVLENYRTGFLPVLAALGLMAAYHALRREWSRTREVQIMLFLLLAGLPVLLEHIVLLQYAHHDFAALKGGVLLCGLAGVGVSRLPGRWAHSLVMGASLAGVLYFHRLNPATLWGTEHLAGQREMGLAIAAEAPPHHAVFFLGYTPEPQVVWYAKRTIFRVDTPEEARALLRRQGTEEGVLFRLDDTGQLAHSTIAAEGPLTGPWPQRIW